jgi:putative tricarboxylic transport membrane protein
MIEDALIALTNLMSVERLGFLVGGVLMGLALGAIPGLGGLVGLAILLPFTFEMDPGAAFAIMIGLISVTATSDTIPAVLFGVPGTVGSAATILDGHLWPDRAKPSAPLAPRFLRPLWAGCSAPCCSP